MWQKVPNMDSVEENNAVAIKLTIDLDGLGLLVLRLMAKQ
jgi:hypothetical protein